MKIVLSILACAAALPALAADPGPAGSAAAATASAPPALTPATTAPSPVQLQLNLHALRVAAEQDELAADLATRTATSPVAAPVTDPGSITAMRAQMNTSMSQLSNKCIGVNAVNKGGNQVLICGDSVNSTQAQAQNGATPAMSAATPAAVSRPTAAAAVPVSAPADLAPQ
jgi:hypothetical protein